MKDVDFEPELSAGQLIGGAVLPREVADLTIWKKTPFDAGHALTDIYMLANTESGQHRLKRGPVVDYRPGWCLWSNKALAARWGWRRDAVERFLVELEKSEIIRRHDIAQYGKVIELIEFGQPFGHPTGSERAANGQPFGHPTGTEGEGEGVIGEGEGVEPAAKSELGGNNFPSLVQAVAYFAKNGSGYTEDQVRLAWHDCNQTVRDGTWMDWQGRAPVGDWRSRMETVLGRQAILSAKPVTGQGYEKSGAEKPGAVSANVRAVAASLRRQQIALRLRALDEEIEPLRGTGQDGELLAEEKELLKELAGLEAAA